MEHNWRKAGKEFIVYDRNDHLQAPTSLFASEVEMPEKMENAKKQ